MLEGRIFSVFIAATGDATELGKIAFDVITDWNNQHSTALRVALLPKMWETGTSEGSDLVIAIWRYLWGAGRAAEVERSLHDDSCEVMQYFSVEPVPRDYLTSPRLQRLQLYQEKMTPDGGTCYWTYKNPEDFRKMLTRHLELFVFQLMSKTKELR